MVGLIAQVLDHRQLFFPHLGGDLLHDPCAGDLVRQRGDHHVAVLPLETGAQPYRAVAGLVQLAQLLARGDDLRAARVIRCRHEFVQRLVRAVGMV